MWPMYAVAILSCFALMRNVQGQSGDGTDNSVPNLPAGLDLRSSYSDCYFDVKAKCEYNGEKFDFLEMWMTKDCHMCTCYDDAGVLCCDVIKRPIDWPPLCAPRIDTKTCKVELVVVGQPQNKCPNHWQKKKKLIKPGLRRATVYVPQTRLNI
ncbi:prostate-associated microseminoprotein-like [Ciona intestinalis]